MLFIGIMLIIWFGVWLYFTVQKHSMMQVMTCIMIDIIEAKEKEEGKEDDD